MLLLSPGADFEEVFDDGTGDDFGVGTSLGLLSDAVLSSATWMVSISRLYILSTL